MALHDNNVVPLNSLTSESDRKKAHLLIDEAHTITLRYLSTLLKRMLDNADDTLFELADKAESNVLQSSYFDAMRELRMQREVIENRFSQYIETGFRKLLKPENYNVSTASEHKSIDAMSLVNESDLEESLAVSSTVAKVNNRLARELYAIEQRFSALDPTKTIHMEDLPLSPKEICEAFRESIKSFDVETSIKLIIYKLYDKYVTSNISHLYEEVNILFIKSDVLPHLKMTIKSLPQARRSDRSYPSEHHKDGSFSPTPSPTSQSLDNGAGYNHINDEKLIGTLQNLLTNKQIISSGYNTNNNTSVPHIDPIDIVNALSSIQMRDSRFGAFESIEQLKEALSLEIKTSISNGKLNLVSTIDNDIIDIVAMIFDFILDDKNLSSMAKALLSRLQIPILKVAISDNEFFSKKQHPARQLLNKMAQAAIGVDDDTRIESSPLLQKIDYIVSRITNSFNDNLNLFDELIIEFDRFYNLSIHQDKKAQDKNQKLFESREKHKLTNAWVMECIASQIKDKEIPKPVYEIISGPWRQVMVNTYLNGSDDSALWKEQLRFIDLLIWSIEPKKTESDKKSLANILLELLITLQDGLSSINLDKKDMDDLLSGLEECHIASMRGENIPVSKNRVHIKCDHSTSSESHETNEIDTALTEMQIQLNKMNKLEEMLNTPILDIDDVVTIKSVHKTFNTNGASEETDEITITTTPHKKVEPLVDDRFWQQTLELKMGQWLNITNKDGKNQHLRMVWKSDYLGECSFTNWKFKVVAEFSFNELAALFRSNQASPIETLPLFERAIDTIINTLHQRTSANN